MTKNQALRTLRMLLVDLKDEKNDIVTVLEDAEIDTGRIAWSDRPINTWRNILDEADKLGKVGNIVEVLDEEYASIQLIEAYQDYLEAAGRTDTHGLLDKLNRPPGAAYNRAATEPKVEERVRELVGNNNLSDALALLKTISKYEDEATIHQAKLNRTKTAARTGTITHDQAQAEYAQITSAILSMLRS